MKRGSARSGFTLVEILGAFFIMTVILTLVTGIFVDNGRQRAAALDKMKESLSAAAVLTQIVDDIEGAVFLTDSSGGDPRDYPWRFYADQVGSVGAQSLRFVSQNVPAANRGEHVSGWIEMAYFLEEEEPGHFVLWRWTSSRPPASANLRVPGPGDDGTMRVALDVSEFGLRFMDPDGGWVDDWDSSIQAPLESLPKAVEVNLTLLRAARRGESQDGEALVPGPSHTRKVLVRMAPIDVDALINLGAPGSGDTAGCFTIENCLAAGDTSWYEDELDQDCNGDTALCAALGNSADTCWNDFEQNFPSVAARAPASCS